MIRFAGFEPDVDIPIVFVGMRPGEKLFEDILTAEEGTLATKHNKIFVAKMPRSSNGSVPLLPGIDQLEALANEGTRTTVIKSLGHLVPSYTPKDSTSEMPTRY